MPRLLSDTQIRYLVSHCCVMLKIYENSLHQVPLDAEILEQSTLTIKLIATYKSGQTSELPEIQYKRK